MSPTPAVICIWDHENDGATAHAAEMLQDEGLTDPQRGRYLLVVRDPNIRRDWSFHTEAALLEKLQYIFEHNDCSRVGVQWYVSGPLVEKLRAMHRRYVPEFPKVN